MHGLSWLQFRLSILFLYCMYMYVHSVQETAEHVMTCVD